MKAKRIIVSGLVIISCLVMVSSFVSKHKFNTINSPKVAWSIIAVNSTSKKYITIKDNSRSLQETGDNGRISISRVIIATPQNSYNIFMEYLAANGYTLLENETNGSILCIEKSGQKEHVEFKVNGYYSLWSWI